MSSSKEFSAADNIDNKSNHDQLPEAAYYRFRKAKESELLTISDIYRAVTGSEGCTWNELYPGDAELHNDFASGGLYVLTRERTVVGAVSVVSENELDDLKCWKINDGSEREFARLAVLPKYQGQGLAKLILKNLFEKLKKDGCRAVHILVAVNNKPAVCLYKAVGFNIMPQTVFMFGNDYCPCEIML